MMLPDGSASESKREKQQLWNTQGKKDVGTIPIYLRQEFPTRWISSKSASIERFQIKSFPSDELLEKFLKKSSSSENQVIRWLMIGWLWGTGPHMGNYPRVIVLNGIIESTLTASIRWSWISTSLQVPNLKKKNVSTSPTKPVSNGVLLR